MVKFIVSEQQAIANGKTPQLKSFDEEVQYWYTAFQSEAGDMVRALVNCEKITIYAPQAGCVGIGTTLSQLCDFVVCSETSGWFTTPFMGLNFCAEGGSSYTFPRVLGPQVANDMLLGGKKLLPAEALARGFVVRTFPDATFHDDVLKFALNLTQYNVDTLKLTKKLCTKHSKEEILKVNDEELLALARCVAGPLAKISLCEFVEGQKKKKAKA